MPFTAGYIYPLQNPTRFDDELGEGYDHVAVPEDMDPGTCSMIDMWPVNSVGEVHPGYDACPVPVRAEDVDMEKGRPLNAALPKPQSIFDSPWPRG